MYGVVDVDVDIVQKIVILVPVRPMTHDPSSWSKFLVRETRTRNLYRLSCILARDFSRARNLDRLERVLFSHKKLGIT